MKYATRCIGICLWVFLSHLGCQGSTGPQGPQGLQGLQGFTGPTGFQGVPGVPCQSCVDTASLQDGAVSSSKITAEAVLSMHLAPRAVTATTITAGAIEATHITDAAVTSPKVQLSYDSIRASQNLSLNLTPAVITGTASTFTPPTTQILYGSHFATLVCPSCTCWCQMYVDSVAYGAKSAASSTTGSVTVSASFTATVTAGLHIVDLRCWSSSATCGTVQATPASMDTGYQYILFSQ